MLLASQTRGVPRPFSAHPVCLLAVSKNVAVQLVNTFSYILLLSFCLWI